MVYDIAALQKLYGANFADQQHRHCIPVGIRAPESFPLTVSGQGAPGANQVYMTVWDGGGNDTYDFSNYAAGLRVSLQPGVLECHFGPPATCKSRQRPVGGGQHLQCLALSIKPRLTDRKCQTAALAATQFPWQLRQQCAPRQRWQRLHRWAGWIRHRRLCRERGWITTIIRTRTAVGPLPTFAAAILMASIR